jgi:hypothetical protein
MVPCRAVLKDAEAVQLFRQPLGGLEIHDRRGELLLMCAAIGPCQLCVVGDQRVLDSGNTARDVVERLALLGVGLKNAAMRPPQWSGILLCRRRLRVGSLTHDAKQAYKPMS